MTENETKETKEWFENFLETYALSNQETREFQKAVACLEEAQQYHAIGTIEELQALKEKAEPKKPILIKRSFTQFYVCPHCSTNEHYEKLFAKVRHCERCGGAFDWS